MNCAKCGKNEDCRVTKVYYASIIGESSKTQNTSVLTTKTVHTTRYTPVQSQGMCICKSCLDKHSKKGIIAFPFVVLLILTIIGGGLQNILGETAMGIVSVIFVGILIFSIITVIKRIAKKDYKRASRYTVYNIAKTELKKQLKKDHPKTRYEFWDKYPAHLKEIKY